MSVSREGPNPLRPYYIPPSLGSPPESNTSPAIAPNVVNKHSSAPPRTTSFGSSARNILADMHYSDYLTESSPSATEILRKLSEEALWEYTSVFLAQPFELAKAVLQVHVAIADSNLLAQTQNAETMRKQPGAYRDDGGLYDLSDDSDDASQSYFTSSAPHSRFPSRASRPRERRDSLGSPSLPHADTPRTPPPLRPNFCSSSHSLQLRSSSSLVAVLSALWTKEGAWGLWKGTNSTYVYTILLSTIATFSRSFISALLALPDSSLSFQISPPSTSAIGLDILSSPSPLSSLAVAVSAAGLAGIILSPLDIARTKLMLTPSTHPPRSILSTLRSLPSWTLPISIAPVTILHSTITTLVSASVPLFLRSKFGIDPLLTPSLFSVGTLVSQAMELVITLPIETVLRRGHLHIAQASTDGRDMQTVVEVGSYKGLVGTMIHIVNEEGESARPVELTRGTTGASTLRAGKVGTGIQRKNGQGLEGLWRGWRVGMWGLVGVWGAAILGGAGNKGGEF